jgi:hypothetical protein
VINEEYRLCVCVGEQCDKEYIGSKREVTAGRRRNVHNDERGA